jgi:hypothetical protein
MLMKERSSERNNSSCDRCEIKHDETIHRHGPLNRRRLAGLLYFYLPCPIRNRPHEIAAITLG